MKHSIVKLFCGLGMLIMILNACKKNNIVVDQNVVPPTYAKFNNLPSTDSVAVYYIRETGEAFKLPVGITTVSDKDRVVQFTYFSTTATQGAQFNAPSSITIPAGSALDSLSIAGIFTGYTSARVDTLVIKITGTEVLASPYKSTFYLILRKECPVVLNDFLGAYVNTTEFLTSPYGPYTTSISSVVTTGPTTGKIVVENIWNNGWGPLTFDLDWTNSSNITAKVEPQPAIPGSNAADVGYSGTMAVKPFDSGNLGTFSACDNTFTLKMQIGVTGLGYFPNIYTVYMAR